MRINNIELTDIDIYDADTAERYENALNEVVRRSENIQGQTTAAVIREQCETVFNFFNELFGEGTDKQIFGDKVNLMTCIKAFESVVSQIDMQKEEAEKIISKYSPNRVLR